MEYWIKYFNGNKKQKSFEEFSHMLNEQKLRPIFYTSTSLSDKAKEMAKALSIEIVENEPLGEFPRIKCNINSGELGGETRIYHLPMDQQYDRTIIGNRAGEFYAFSEKKQKMQVFAELLNIDSNILITMKIHFEYNKEKDIWCLLNKGKSSNNSPNSTKVYGLLVSKYGENPSEEDTSKFIDNYLEENNVSLDDYIRQYSADWELIAGEYHKRAEEIFGTTLPNNITAYLTINNRNPYKIFDNMFYVTVPRETVRKTIMHELWHFYTWYGLGTDQEEKLGKQKYNDVKEAMTVLLIEECGDLMPEGISDEGYPQHQELRREISKLWHEQKDIRWIWNKVTNL